MTPPTADAAYTSMMAMADHAGEIMRATLGAASTLKGDGSPVTDSDTAINNNVIEYVAERHPGASVLGEEASAGTLDGGVFIVDPIDGTAAFAANLCVAAFSCAYMVDGTVVAAVVDDPWAGLRFTAHTDHGAAVNGNPLTMPDEPHSNLVNLEGTRGTGYGALNLNGALHGAGYQLCCYRAFISPACRVATGHLTGAAFLRTSPWDCAAVAYIIKEAGGTVTDLSGTPIEGAALAGGLVAAHPNHHTQILEALHSAGVS